MGPTGACNCVQRECTVALCALTGNTGEHYHHFLGRDRAVEICVHVRTYHFLCHPEELRDIADHIPKAVIQTHIRPNPRWKLSPGIRVSKPVSKIRHIKASVAVKENFKV